MDKTDYIMILLSATLAAYWCLALAIPNIVSPLVTTYIWFTNLSLSMGYPGAFFVSLLGNATVLIPFPFIGVPYILGGLQDQLTSQYIFDPTVIGIIAGTGALLGEMTGYITGYIGGSLIEEEKRSAFLRFVEYHPRTTPLILWILAATPLPDDVLIIPLGISKYPWWKVVIPQLVGKVMFLTAIAWAGRLSLSFVDAFVNGVSTEGVMSRTIETISLFLVLLMIYIIIKREAK